MDDKTFICSVCLLRTPWEDAFEHVADVPAAAICKSCYEEKKLRALNKAAEIRGYDGAFFNSSPPYIPRYEENAFGQVVRFMTDEESRQDQARIYAEHHPPYSLCEVCGCAAPDPLEDAKRRAVCARCYSDPDHEEGVTGQGCPVTTVYPTEMEKPPIVTSSVPVLNEQGEHIYTKTTSTVSSEDLFTREWLRKYADKSAILKRGVEMALGNGDLSIPADLECALSKLHPVEGDVIVLTYPQPTCPEQGQRWHEVTMGLHRIVGDGIAIVSGPEGFNVEMLVDYLRGQGYRVEKECPQCGWTKKVHEATCYITEFCHTAPKGTKIDTLPCGHMRCTCVGRLE